MNTGSRDNDQDQGLNQQVPAESVRTQAGSSEPERTGANPQFAGHPLPDPNAVRTAGTQGEPGGTAEEPGVTQEEMVALVMSSNQPTPPGGGRLMRVLCSELVDITWKGIDGCTETTVANMEEIWRTGATLDTERSLPEGTTAIVRRGKDQLTARVLYCQQNLTGHTVGIRFTERSEWSPEQFLPAHAVELGSLGHDLPDSVDGEERDPEGPNSAMVRHPTHSFGGPGSLMAPGSPVARGVVRSFSLESLAPLIARGSLVALHHQMCPKQPA